MGLKLAGPRLGPKSDSGSVSQRGTLSEPTVHTGVDSIPGHVWKELWHDYCVSIKQNNICTKTEHSLVNRF